MKKRLNSRLFPLIAAGLLAGAAAAYAHGGATGIVKERMDLMDRIGKAMKVIVPMMKEKTDFDPKAYSAAAREIGQHGGEAMTKLFPAGSLDKPTEAKPEIWQDWAKFNQLAGELQDAASDLSAVSGTAQSVDVLAAPFGRLARTCRDCHKAFRVKK